MFSNKETQGYTPHYARNTTYFQSRQRLEHLSCCEEPRSITRRFVHVPRTLDKFRTKWISLCRTSVQNFPFRETKVLGCELVDSTYSMKRIQCGGCRFEITHHHLHTRPKCHEIVKDSFCVSSRAHLCVCVEGSVC